jgi:hypothetical protein
VPEGIGLRRCGRLLGAVAVAWIAPRCLAAGYDLPERALAIPGGVIAVQGGVMRDPERPTLPFGKLRYPTRYIALLLNETQTPVWIEIDLQLPDKKKKTQPGFGPIPGGKSWMWWWSSFGVAWDEPIPLKITIYADEGRRTKLASEETSLFFESADKKEFLSDAPAVGRGQVAVRMLTGWREIHKSDCRAEGSVADATLRWDVCLKIWKLESVDRHECRHEIASAERLAADLARPPTQASDELGSKIEKFKEKGLLVVEKWSVKSCDAVVPYEVMMLKSPEGGADFLVFPLSPAAGEDRVEFSKKPAEESPPGGATLAPENLAGDGSPQPSFPSPAPGGEAELEPYDALKSQFTLSIPRGWHVTDQAAMMGHAGPEGVVVFSAVEMQAPTALPSNASKKDTEALVQQMMKGLGQIDSGEIPSFFVDRYRALPGMSCAGIDEDAKKQLLKALTGPALGKKAEILEPPTVEGAALGGCQGLRVMVKAKDATGKEIWMLVHTVSDGTTGYDFALRNQREYFEKNRPTFEKALESIKLAKSPS